MCQEESHAPQQPSYSITRSAEVSKSRGIVRLSAAAVLRLRTNSNFVGNCNRKIAWLFTAQDSYGVYCSSLGGIRGGRSGANDTPSPARGAALNAPVEGSPPDVSMTYVRNDVLSYGFDKAPVSSAKIGGATALRVSGGNLARSLVGLFGERLAVWKAIGSGDAAWSIAFVKRFDPQINRTRIAFQRVRFHDTRLQ